VGIPILVGRDIGPQDTAASRKVAVINRAMAKFYFGNTNPIGRTFTVSEGEEGKPSQPTEIVGVSEDAHDHELKTAVERRLYRSVAQTAASTSFKFEIRTVGDPAAVAEVARRRIREFDSRVPIYTTRTVDQLLDSALSNEILVARISSFFGFLALGLACVGLY